MYLQTAVKVGGDPTAAYLYTDAQQDIEKIILVNGKKASVTLKVECQKKQLRYMELGSYETHGIHVEDWMKHEVVWFKLTYHGKDTGYIGYKWATGEVGYYG